IRKVQKFFGFSLGRLLDEDLAGSSRFFSIIEQTRGFNPKQNPSPKQIPVTELSSPQNTQSPRQALQKDTQLPQTSVPIPNVEDEVVFKDRDDIVVRATTTAASLDAAQVSGVNTPENDEERNEQHDLTDFVPPTPHDSPLSGGHTPRSDEGRPNINELMAIVGK
ncbi:hypothetical protein Tco_1075801, partial [Tanacetum coccineum]